ncbi:MAG: hypothetical protein H6670_14835 [Anaerolineaceae bacterium]|nr:hypothetical protein [Anaerolineaceae bacterium]
MQLTCPNCQTPIPPENVNIQKTLALCPECGSVFNFSEDQQSSIKVKRRKAKKPSYLTIHDNDDNGLHLSYPMLVGRTNKIVLGVLLSVLVAFMVLVGNELLADGKILPVILLGLIFGGMGAALASSFLMRSHLQLADDGFSAYSWPIPMNKVDLYNEEIIEFTYEEMTATLESAHTSARFNVYALLAGDRKRLITGSISEENLAAYIAQELNQRLNESRMSESAIGNLRDGDLVDEPELIEDLAFLEDEASASQQ